MPYVLGGVGKRRQNRRTVVDTAAGFVTDECGCARGCSENERFITLPAVTPPAGFRLRPWSSLLSRDACGLPAVLIRFAAALVEINLAGCVMFPDAFCSPWRVSGN